MNTEIKTAISNELVNLQKGKTHMQWIITVSGKFILNKILYLKSVL